VIKISESFFVGVLFIEVNNDYLVLSSSALVICDCCNKLTPWSRDFLEKLVVAQLISMFTGDHH
jgi:hypothetical protein